MLAQEEKGGRKSKKEKGGENPNQTPYLQTRKKEKMKKAKRRTNAKTQASIKVGSRLVTLEGRI